MKSTALGELLPQWTKFVVTDLSGRDPLGLARVATNILDYVMPGIVVATNQARYYAIYSWILSNIGAEAPATESGFADAFQRRESAFALATLLHDPEASPVGKRAAERELARADSDIRTAFRVLPSHDLGGFGQYYAGSLYKMGLTQRPEGEFDQITATRGARLAAAVEKTLKTTTWAQERAYLKPRIGMEVLTSSAGRLTLDAISEPFAAHERLALTEMFLGFDAEEVGHASLRRQTLARLLHLVDAYAKHGIPLAEDELVSLDDQLVLGPAYFGALVGADGKAAAPYEPPPYLVPCNAMWRQFCLHEIVSWVLDSVLAAVLELLGDAPGRGMTLDEVVRSLSGKALIEAIKTHSGLEAETPRELLLAVGVNGLPTEASAQKAREDWSLASTVNEDAFMRLDAQHPVEILARALPCLALVYSKWRKGSDDPAWSDVRRMVGPELAATSVLPRLDSWLAANSDWEAATRSLVELVMGHHDRVMYEKGRLEACWVHRDGDRLIYDQEHSFQFPDHASRQWAALRILVDLGLVAVDPEGRHSPTVSGAEALARTAELGK